MKDLNLILETAQKSWVESGHPPDLFWRIQPPLFAPYSTFGALADWPWPLTIREAVDQLLLRSCLKTKIHVLQFPLSEIGLLHFGVGTWIRNTFGLWEDNLHLFKAIRVWQENAQLSTHDTVEGVERLYQEKWGNQDPTDHPDNLSAPLIGAFWGELHVYEWPELTGDWEKVRLEQ